MDSNGKLEFTRVRTFHSLDHKSVINLRGIPNDFAVRCLRNLLIVAPRHEINKNTAVNAVFLFCACVKTGKSV